MSPFRAAPAAATRDLPRLPLALAPTPVESCRACSTRSALAASRQALDLLVKRDDAIPFGFGGNKIRKLQLVAAQALAEGADTLITTGGVQSNHARATAAVAARLGLGCVLVANGAPPAKPTAQRAARSAARRRRALRRDARGARARRWSARRASCARRDGGRS